MRISKRTWIWILFIGIWCSFLTLVLVCFIALYFAPKPKLFVSLHNVGTENMRLVVVHVKGRSHLVGDLLAGESSTVILEPKSESDIQIEFTDMQGKQKKLNVGGYIEAGYKGAIEIKLNSNEILEVRGSAQPSVY